MKKLSLFLLLALIGLTASAKPVDATTARRVAESYLRARGMKNPAALVDITSSTAYTEFYLFAAPDGGFILVSGDDCVVPVLGWSVDNTFAASNMPANIRGVLDDYERIIRTARRNGEPSLTKEWQLAASGQWATGNGRKSGVGPLLTTIWDQEPYYNILCPFDNAGHALTPTGCVATSMSQVMKYYNYPATGYGTHTDTINPDYGPLTADFGATTYDWEHMPNALTAASSETEVNAVATLMYQAGVAVDMMYTSEGSGAYTDNLGGFLQPTAQTALQTYFKYRPDMTLLYRDLFTDEDYCARLRAELDLRRPILVDGEDERLGGHSFICDGYNNDGLFHINWGWSGHSNGYYAMGSLVPDWGGGRKGSYNIRTKAIIGVRPDTNWAPGSTTTVTVSVNSPATITGAGSYAFGDTVTLEVIVPEGYRFAHWNDGSPYRFRQFIARGGNYHFTAEVEPICGDTLSYCRPYTMLSHFCKDRRLGIRLPASLLTEGRYLEAVQLYTLYPGIYNLTVLSGTDTPTDTLFTSTQRFRDADVDQWNLFPVTVPLPVDITRNLWIAFSSDDTLITVAANMFSSGHPDECLVGDSLVPDENLIFQLMIRGIFGDGSAASCAATVLDWEEDFEAGADCWRLSGGFAVDSVATSHGGTRCLAADAEAWAVTPAIVLPDDLTNTALSYYFNAPAGTAYEAYISVTGNAPANFHDIIYTESGEDNGWQQRAISLTRYAGQTVHIAFHSLSPEGGSPLLFDDIRVGANDTAQIYHYIRTDCNNPEWGTVTGGGMYVEGETVVLQAVPADGYQFRYWKGRKTTNPLTILAYNNYDYYAYFVDQRPVRAGDTISYCGNDSYIYMIHNTAADFGFGMKLPVSALTGCNYLNSVMFYCIQAANYTIKIYRGGDERPRTEIYSQPISVTTDEAGWQEIVLSDTVAIPDEDLWVTVQVNDLDVAIALSDYTGHGGDVCSGRPFWEHISDVTGYLYTFMVKAITGAAPSGIGEVEDAKLKAEIYPNPTTGHVTVSVSKPSTLTIVDLTGRTVVPSTTLDAQYSILNLNKGIYFVRITDGDSATVQKLIVQ